MLVKAMSDLSISQYCYIRWQVNNILILSLLFCLKVLFTEWNLQYLHQTLAALSNSRPKRNFGRIKRLQMEKKDM